MKFRLNELHLTCKKAVAPIVFDDISYFYGELGAGKSTIARLIDYCLGSSELVMTPALQSEFVSVSLLMTVGDTPLRVERERESQQALASWGDNQLIVPVRQAAGVVLPNTQVEVLSDLVFHLQGLQPPRVRKSQLNEDSTLERLSLRDLLWYCYLDQDSMDSSFFHLDRDADTFKRLKSRNVLRAILGVHQERVAELEQRLEEIRRERLGYIESARVLEQSLQETQFSTLEEIEVREKEIAEKQEMLQRRIAAIRTDKATAINHVTDQLRSKARHIASELEAADTALEELTTVNANDRRHRNEILALSTKVRRLESARAVLNDVEFTTCPRCTRQLPNRGADLCHVCGQTDEPEGEENDDGERTQADIASRVKELEEMMEAQSVQMNRIRRRREELHRQKETVDQELTVAMEQYDSAYLAEALAVERESAEAAHELYYLKRIKVLPSRVGQLKQQSDALAAKESTTRRELNEARAAAEQDLSNLQKLKKLFLDCLLRAKVPGFKANDIVQMDPPWFLPEVHGGSGDLATTSFSTLGSGGKKNLFKCCFALAVHRLAAEMKTLLPTIMVIDSPMKNISERENRAQFEGFHDLLYELCASELAGTQVILIDKEFCPPVEGVDVSVTSRHMRVDSDTEPPLIPYYRGK